MIPSLSSAWAGGIPVCMFVDLNGGNEPSKIDASGMLRLFPI